jgi:hypothetical protein
MENLWLLQKRFPKGSRIRVIGGGYNGMAGTVITVGYFYISVSRREAAIYIEIILEFLGDTIYVSGIDLEII